MRRTIGSKAVQIVKNIVKTHTILDTFVQYLPALSNSTLSLTILQFLAQELQVIAVPKFFLILLVA